MNTVLSQKLVASFIHFLISLTIIGGFLLLVFLIWYPDPLYLTEGLSHITIILLGVDLALGPLMTLILYKKGKKYLYFDLFIIAFLQLSAFFYGAHTIHKGRPVYIVFAMDMFKTVSQPMLKQEDIEKLPDQFRFTFFDKPIYIYTNVPTDPKERSELLWKSLEQGLDIDQLPEYYEDYSKHIHEIADKKQSYQQLFQSGSPLNTIFAQQLSSLKLSKQDVGLYPFHGKEKSIIAIVKLNNGEIVGYLNIPPPPVSARRR